MNPAGIHTKLAETNRSSEHFWIWLGSDWLLYKYNVCINTAETIVARAKLIKFVVLKSSLMGPFMVVVDLNSKRFRA